MEKRRRGGVSSLMVLAALLTVAAMPSPPRVAAALSPDYYKDSCPDLESIVRYEVTRKKNETVVTIPATLRLVFHDCMVGADGPYWRVELGRLDALASRASDVKGKLPAPEMHVKELTPTEERT
ncbi:unnamed protein product [Miscanthus lutarioriparius]|uniref:Plant heme peroxidase family profile domain-containing protein n=1 Tax=Miscanthus lutarioriparius TaxID=422564 RepID=A0A811SQE6_9POAL|nr:unnamed protein product [Miscanthus lutarioriparius]